MIQDRPQYAGSLEFVYINDLATAGVFDDAVKGVDGVINVASVSVIWSQRNGILDFDGGITACSWTRRKGLGERDHLTSC